MNPADLANVELFHELTEEELERLAKIMRCKKHRVGEPLVEEGDVPTKFFVLLSGHVTVHRDGSHVADLGPGDFFGEVGVLSLDARNASVIATTPVEVAEVFGWDLRNLLDNMPELGAKLEQAAGERGTQG